MNTLKQKRFGEFLVAHAKIVEEQLNQALADQKQNGGKIGQVIVKLGFLKETEMLSALAEYIGIPFISLTRQRFDKELIQRLPVHYARRFRAIVLSRNDKGLVVGMSDPLDLLAYDELVRLLKEPLSLALVRESELLNTVDLLYRRTEEISEFAEDLTKTLSPDAESQEEEEDIESKPVVKLLQSLFEDATQVQASDIHIEPDEKTLRIRQRVDGVLHEQILNEKRIASAMTLRLKLMAGLNIAEKRLPQDGRFNIQVKGKKVDVRLSTMPIEHGESVVMRLLDQSAVALDLKKVGMPDGILKRFQRNIRRPYGMILVTGPTGSGKTTTLYSALAELNSPDKKIITVEDPVEYRMSRISQVQINEKINLDFAKVLRTALRQDPDIILVGEIRDHETASIAIRAALTGHLVLASLHTNDAVSSAMRLMDMGLEGYLVATAVRAVLAQRLVRRICKSCYEPCEITEAQRSWAVTVGGVSYQETVFYHGKGCTYCNNTGFRGRVGIFELFELNKKMIEALSTNDPRKFEEAAEEHKSQYSLALSALQAAALGQTTLDESISIAGEFDEVYDEDTAIPETTENKAEESPGEQDHSDKEMTPDQESGKEDENHAVFKLKPKNGN